MKDNQFLPAYEPAGTVLQAQTSPPHHLLVVDDDPSLRELNTLMLARAGYEAEGAEDGAAAWQALNTNNYDLLITDNNMPNLSGVELLKKLRATHMELPVIMATGRLPEEEFARYPWLKPAAVLLKPYTPDAMLRTVKKVLREADRTDDEPWQCPTKSPRRILVVDEDRDLCRLYADVLAPPNFHVHVAQDGDAGWEALQGNQYDLLITEHDLPKLTGINLVRKLRAAHMDLPVVMAARRLPAYELARNESLHFAALLPKPFAIETLLDTVQNVLRATTSAGEQSDPPWDWRVQSSAGVLRV